MVDSPRPYDQRDQPLVCSWYVLIWVGFDLFISLRSQKIINFQKNRTKNGPNGPNSTTKKWVEFGFLSFEPTNNAGQDNPQWPRANKNMTKARNQHKSTSRMYAQRAAAAEAGGLAWQMVCTTPSYNSAKARSV